MLRLLQEKGRVAVVADQYGSPTSATNLAEAVVLAAEGKMLGTAGSPMSIVGIRHFADAGIVSWYELAAAVRDEGVAAGMLPCSAAVDPILTEDYRSLARRPRYSALDSIVLRRELNLPEIHWRDALAQTFRRHAGSPTHSKLSVAC